MEKYGVFQLYEGEDPQVDIVAVHGLNGDAYNTWTTKVGTCWLKDSKLLPKAVKNSRIMTFGYNANATSFMGSTSSDRILQHAQTLVAQLEADRALADASRRPLIFICHSLGGIIVKRALAYSASRTSKKIAHLHSIYVSTYSILFLGTPHNGSSKAQLASIGRRLLDTVAPSRVWDTDGQLVDALKEGSETLQNITDQFAPLMKRFHVYFFWEQEKTNLGTSWGYVVDEHSAAPILDDTERSGIAASHTEMCKFESTSASGYITVVSAVMRYAREAPAVIETRWKRSDEMLSTQRSNEASELVN